MSFLGLGQFSRFHIYIIIVILCQFISDYLLGFNKINKKEILEIFKFYAKIKRHLLFKNMFEFLGYIIGGIIIYFITKRWFGKKKENDVSMTSIQRKRELYLENKTSCDYFVLFIIGFFISFNTIENSIACTLQIENHFWVVELLSITIFSAFVFNNNIKNHHKAAIIIITPLIITEFISLSLPLSHHKCATEKECKEKYISDNNLYEMMKKKYGVYSFFVLGVTLFSIIMKDYSWIKSKYLMDIRGINVYNILIFTGVIGFIIVSILFTFSTLYPCDTVNVIDVDFLHEHYTEINNRTFPMSKQICFVSEYDEKNKLLKFYYDHFFVFFKDYNLREDKFEIFVIAPLYFLMTLIINVSNIMIIRYLDPNYILINKNVSFFLEKLVYYFFFIKCNEEYITLTCFIMEEIQLLISIISNLIYIEIIELKCCNLDYDLKKNIDTRGYVDRMNTRKSLELSSINDISFQEE